MDSELPALLANPLKSLQASLQRVGTGTIDLNSASWEEIERGVARVLGGPFDQAREDHSVVMLGLVGLLVARMRSAHGAFLYPRSDSQMGVEVGFPQAVLAVSPFGSILSALAQAKLGMLDELEKSIATALARARFSGAGTRALQAEDYQRLFDPSFLQVVGIDKERLRQFAEATPTRLRLDLQEALMRTARLPEQAKKELEAQLLGALAQFDPAVPLLKQTAKGLRFVEVMLSLYAIGEATPPASMDYWTQIALPLLLIGNPDQFPPLTPEDREAVAQGADLRFVYLEAVPYKFPAADENGFLGVFPVASATTLFPELADSAPPRLFKVDAQPIKAALEAFDATAVQAAIGRFEAHARSSVEEGPRKSSSEAADATAIIGSALATLGSIKAIVGNPRYELAFRSLTEVEASSEPSISEVRKAMSGPRIILATS